MIAELADVMKFLDADEEEETKIVSAIQKGVEGWVEDYCNRKFEAALYVKERHDGKGIRQENLYFDQYPVLAVNLDGLVWDAVTKRVTRNDGGSFIKDGFIPITDYALVQNSDKNSGLMLIAAVTATTMDWAMAHTIVDDTEDNNVVISHFRELWIGDNLINGNNYEVDNNHIYYPGSFPIGHKNIRMTYYAGYSSSNMPEELKLAVKIITKSIYQKKEEEIFGVEKYTIGDINITREDNDMPREALAILSKYRRIVI